jgi:hypothetical protein
MDFGETAESNKLYIQTGLKECSFEIKKKIMEFDCRRN